MQHRADVRMNVRIVRVLRNQRWHEKWHCLKYNVLIIFNSYNIPLGFFNLILFAKFEHTSWIKQNTILYIRTHVIWYKLSARFVPYFFPIATSYGTLHTRLLSHHVGPRDSFVISRDRDCSASGFRAPGGLPLVVIGKGEQRKGNRRCTG